VDGHRRKRHPQYIIFPPNLTRGSEGRCRKLFNEVDDDDQDKPIGFSLEYLIEKYGDKKLRYVDSIPRKTGHLIGITIMFLQIQFTTNRVLTQLQTLSLASSILAAMFVFFNNYWIDSWFACHLFALSRIRDGTYGRINLCVAVPTAAIGTVVVLFTIMYGIVLHVENPSLQILIVNLIYAPLIVGDAMGELIGGPFGGTFFPTFPVQGFGEINRKSIEGCTAVFCGSLVGCVATCYLYGASTSSWILLGLALSLITTLVETAAFRSTDNFLIPVVNAGVVLLALGPFGDSFNQ